jgi:Co/Zn/Cd efflux system component
MHNNNDHSHSHTQGLRREGNRKSLTIALITFGIMLVEATGGWMKNIGYHNKSFIMHTNSIIC